MAKKQHCARIPKDACRSSVASAAIGLEKTCAGKTEAVNRLFIEVRTDVEKRRITPEAGAKLLREKVRSVEATCRLQNARMKKVEQIAREAAEKAAAEEREVNRFNGLGRIRGRKTHRPSLLGLGLFGL